MARREHDRPGTLEEAIAQLKRDPAQPVHAQVENLEVELRVVTPEAEPAVKLGDFLAASGGWQGESAEDLLRRLRQARDEGTSSEPPAAS